jgi:hypothetical protein
MSSGETITVVGFKPEVDAHPRRPLQGEFEYNTHLGALYLCSKWMTLADIKRGTTSSFETWSTEMEGDIVNLSSVYSTYEGDGRSRWSNVPDY